VKVIYFVRTIILRKTTTGLLQWVSIVENELVLSTQRLFEKMLFGWQPKKDASLCVIWRRTPPNDP